MPLTTTMVRSPSANLVVAQLLFLESENPDKDIFFYINSPGRPEFQIMGIANPTQGQLIAEVFKELGRTRALVVHGFEYVRGTRFGGD